MAAKADDKADRRASDVFDPNAGPEQKCDRTDVHERHGTNGHPGPICPGRSEPA